jgi:hypothetical protein
MTSCNVGRDNEPIHSSHSENAKFGKFIFLEI